MQLFVSCQDGRSSHLCSVNVLATSCKSLNNKVLPLQHPACHLPMSLSGLSCVCLLTRKAVSLRRSWLGTACFSYQCTARGKTSLALEDMGTSVSTMLPCSPGSDLQLPQADSSAAAVEHRLVGVEYSIAMAASAGQF